MKLLFSLAWRNLWRKKRRSFITLHPVIFALLLAIALMLPIEVTREVMTEAIGTNSTSQLQVQDALYHDEPSMDHALDAQPGRPGGRERQHQRRF